MNDNQQKDVLIAVAKALTNAVKTSVGHIDSLSAKELTAGLAEAQSGMGE